MANERVFIGCWNCQFFKVALAEEIRNRKDFNAKNTSQLAIPPLMSGVCNAYPGADLTLTNKGFKPINQIHRFGPLVKKVTSYSFCTSAKVKDDKILPCFIPDKSIPR